MKSEQGPLDLQALAEQLSTYERRLCAVEDQVAIGNLMTRYGLSEEEIESRIRDLDPDFVGITCTFSGFERDCTETAAVAKRAKPGIPVVLGGEGRPLDVGRAHRLATPVQRIALRAMYRTCAIDGCDRHFDACHIHHIVEWDEFGLTDIDNLVPVCSFHHHRAHEGRWRLQLDASTRQLTVTLPDGSYHSRSLPDLLAERNAA